MFHHCGGHHSLLGSYWELLQKSVVVGAVLNFEHGCVWLYFYFDVVADTLPASIKYVLRGNGA